MKSILHCEFDVTVTAIRPWGLEVELQDGTPGFVDNTKNPFWGTSDQSIITGAVLRAAVIDDTRTPVRLSAIAADLDIARAKRSAEHN
ncbi:hypothetical protein [Streptomyces sp. NPDC089919]|uniref:hypothetical protein n=1 Tax=Streptomyces sp. NPDC089919 TaxID=3155188 RepID=UPI003428C554